MVSALQWLASPWAKWFCLSLINKITDLEVTALIIRICHHQNVGQVQNKIFRDSRSRLVWMGRLWHSSRGHQGLDILVNWEFCGDFFYLFFSNCLEKISSQFVLPVYLLSWEKTFSQTVVKILKEEAKPEDFDRFTQVGKFTRQNNQFVRSSYSSRKNRTVMAKNT